MEMVYRLDEIDHAAKQLLAAIDGRRVVAFEGEMGAGKTTLIRAMCQQFGVLTGVSSPTFSIINEYESPGGPIFHIDLYRCSSAEEATRAGVEECLYSGHLCLVEWPSRAESLFPDDTATVAIAQLDEQTRKIIVNCTR